MSYSRKTTAAATFAVAFGMAITLTALLRLRPDSPPAVTVERAPVAPAARAPFRVEQAIVDFAKRQTITTLKLDAAAGDELPERVWVWADYCEIAPAAAPPVDEQGSKPWLLSGDETRIAQPASAVMRLLRWTSRPEAVSVGDGRLRVVAECQVCGERPAGKPTFYARVHVAASRPDAFETERAGEGFDVINATPVVVQGIDK